MTPRIQREGVADRPCERGVGLSRNTQEFMILGSTLSRAAKEDSGEGHQAHRGAPTLRLGPFQHADSSHVRKALDENTTSVLEALGHPHVLLPKTRPQGSGLIAMPPGEERRPGPATTCKDLEPD